MAVPIKAGPLALIAVLALGLGRVAHAQSGDEGVDLQWNVPSTCMPAAVARAEIGALIRADRGGERARARVLIEGTQQLGYVAHIEIARGTSAGERELRGSSCDDLADAAVLIIAMAIDPEGAAARAAAAERAARAPDGEGAASPSAEPPTTAAQSNEQTEGPGPTREAPKEPEPQEPDSDEQPAEEKEEASEEEEEEPSDPRKSSRFVLGMRGSADAGSLPDATLGLGPIAGLHWQRLRLELQALAYLPQVEERGPTPASAAEIELYTGALTGCFDVLGARDEERALGACGAVEAGLSRGQPQAASNGRSTAGLWLAGFAGLDVRQRVVGPLQLRLLAEIGMPVVRPSYEIAPFGRVFQASPVLGRFGISAFVLFP